MDEMLPCQGRDGGIVPHTHRHNFCDIIASMIMQVDPIEEYKTKACIVLGQLVYEYKLKAKVFLDSSMLPEAQNALDNAIKYNNLLKEI